MNSFSVTAAAADSRVLTALFSSLVQTLLFSSGKRMRKHRVHVGRKAVRSSCRQVLLSDPKRKEQSAECFPAAPVLSIKHIRFLFGPTIPAASRTAADKACAGAPSCSVYHNHSGNTIFFSPKLRSSQPCLSGRSSRSGLTRLTQVWYNDIAQPGQGSVKRTAVRMDMKNPIDVHDPEHPTNCSRALPTVFPDEKDAKPNRKALLEKSADLSFARAPTPEDFAKFPAFIRACREGGPFPDGNEGRIFGNLPKITAGGKRKTCR